MNPVSVAAVPVCLIKSRTYETDMWSIFALLLIKVFKGSCIFASHTAHFLCWAYHTNFAITGSIVRFHILGSASSLDWSVWCIVLLQSLHLFVLTYFIPKGYMYQPGNYCISIQFSAGWPRVREENPLLKEYLLLYKERDYFFT